MCHSINILGFVKIVCRILILPTLEIPHVRYLQAETIQLTGEIEPQIDPTSVGDLVETGES